MEGKRLLEDDKKIVSFLNIKCSIASREGFFSCETVSKQILQNISGFAKPGEILAIMGPSGSGKTTLLDILAHRNFSGLSTTGEIFVNKKNGMKEIINRGAYVTQEDILYSSLTVRETIKYAALLRLPFSLSYDEKMRKVDEVIEMLDLTAIQHSKVGGTLIRGISGGEKRRLSIGIEIITNPSILLADEITSGLDSYAALSVMKVLKKMTERGVTVITTIHQPSSQIFQMFDKLLLLSNGEEVYFGKANRAIDYFDRLGFVLPIGWNPADYFLDIISSSNNSYYYYSHSNNNYNNNNNERNNGKKEGGKGGGGDVRSLLVSAFQKNFLHNPSNNSNLSHNHIINNNNSLIEKGNKFSDYNDYLSGEESSSHRSFDNIINNNNNNDNNNEEEVEEGKSLVDQMCEYHNIERSKFFEKSKNETKISKSTRNLSQELCGNIRHYSTPFYYQIFILLQRNLLRLSKDPMIIAQLFISYLFSAILMSLMFSNLKSNVENQMTLCLSFMLNLFGINAFFSVGNYIQEATIYRREYVSSYYSTSSYYISKMLCFMPINLCVCVIYSAIIFYWLNIADRSTSQYFLMLFLNYLTMETFIAVNEIFGIVFTNLQSGIIVAGLVNTLLMLFNGVFINYPNIPSYLQWVYWTVFMTYSMSGVMLLEYNTTDSGKQWLTIFGVQIEEVWTCIYALLGFYIFFRIMGYIALRVVGKSRGTS